jgi:hypothetical protein
LYALQMPQARLQRTLSGTGRDDERNGSAINIDEHRVHESHERHTIFTFVTATTSTRACQRDRLLAAPLFADARWVRPRRRRIDFAALRYPWIG